MTPGIPVGEIVGLATWTTDFVELAVVFDCLGTWLAIDWTWFEDPDSSTGKCYS